MQRRDFLKTPALLPGLRLLDAWVPTDLPRTAPNGMRMLTDAHTFTVAGTPGVYHHSAGIVSTGAGQLVCTYRTCDEHVATWSNLNAAFSSDGGKTWFGHKILSESGSLKTGGCWVAPQTHRWRDGRIAVLADFGKQSRPAEWPMLSQWQKPPLGMQNHLFVSADGGKTWQNWQVDEVGGEPSYVIELSNGTLLYTRTDSAPTDAKKYPALPWGKNYYKSTGVFSDDGGKTFTRTVPIFDDPLLGDCEVGIVEYAPGKILAMSRIGDAGSALGQPSRLAFSEDFGKTWSKPVLAPIYGHRPCVNRLADGRLFVTFRHANASTPGTYAWAFDPKKAFDYGPSSFLLNEANCRLENGALVLDTKEGIHDAVEFIAYPLEDDDSSVTVEATLAVADADRNGCQIAAGVWVRFLPNRVEFADLPQHGFDLDATTFHTYKIITEKQRVQLFVDGSLRLDVPLTITPDTVIPGYAGGTPQAFFDRRVGFGNRRGQKNIPDEIVKRYRDGIPHQQKPMGYFQNRSRSQWKAVRIRVKNRRDHSIDWAWEARSGKYPDQFRRDQLIRVEENSSLGVGNCGYSSWCQQPDGTVVIADYTTTKKDLDFPILRAYRLDPKQV
jgi:hypothetical protein